MLAKVPAHRREAAVGPAVLVALARAPELTFRGFVRLAFGVHQAVGLVERMADPVIAQVGDRTG